jgi:hypothetical protein
MLPSNLVFRQIGMRNVTQLRFNLWSISAISRTHQTSLAECRNYQLTFDPRQWHLRTKPSSYTMPDLLFGYRHYVPEWTDTNSPRAVVLA